MTPHRIQVGDLAFHALPGETLLQAARRCAVPLPHSCGAGSCHACALRVSEGAVTKEAQGSLPRELRDRGYVLACRCVPDGTMRLDWADPADRRVDALLLACESSGAFLHVRLEAARALACLPGDAMQVEVPGMGRCTLEVVRVESGGFEMEGLCVPGEALARVLTGLPFGSPAVLQGPVASRTGPQAEVEVPLPDPALWREISGPRVHAILQAFYADVYEHPRLAPFFRGVTRQRAVEKQHSFMHQMITGDRVYFGDRPRNAHHWMVISADLFDERQALMRDHLLAAGLTPAQVARWQRFEVHYRPDIVKSAPWPRRFNGRDLPLDGYRTEALGEASLCDHCGRAVAVGEAVTYHVRLGTLACDACHVGVAAGA